MRIGQTRRVTGPDLGVESKFCNESAFSRWGVLLSEQQKPARRSASVFIHAELEVIMAKPRTSICLIAAACMLSTLSGPLSKAVAQVRREPSATAMLSDREVEQLRRVFDQNGFYRVAGGVLPAGHAVFLLEAAGGPKPVPVTDVQPVMLPDGNVALAYRGFAYRLGMPQGLACPLGRFVERDGLIAYTKPRYMDADARRTMLQAGLVHHQVAREFDNTPFVRLLKAADFGDTEALPLHTAQYLMDSINRAHSLMGSIIDASENLDDLVGSYLNSDMQVDYRVYLMPKDGRIEVGGVPLRYYWKAEPNGRAGVFSIEMYAQDWPVGAHLTNLVDRSAQPTQYDIINFFQVAGGFRQLHASEPLVFAAFARDACK